MSSLRIPNPPLPKPLYRLVKEKPVTAADVDAVRKSLSTQIENLQKELKLEKELIKKHELTGKVLQEILSSPAYISQPNAPAAEAASAPQTEGGEGGVAKPEAPIEYVEVQEVVLTD